MTFKSLRKCLEGQFHSSSKVLSYCHLKLAIGRVGVIYLFPPFVFFLFLWKFSNMHGSTDSSKMNLNILILHFQALPIMFCQSYNI